MSRYMYSAQRNGTIGVERELLAALWCLRLAALLWLFCCSLLLALSLLCEYIYGS